ncbi:HAD family hydrolase [Clostridium uliginosum]|uniref:Haloacid dehalogenase superfamily, subfamily IA, variant 3 with third motif having DD or ED/haloacid dehalogenase superfamily, subfamily IA, variant 1 with third motif having Dx(3-4)D or Dx(3-4)E n=1 Tax=Clostridium uliginosum TaxID=119641 RepID=A0A1I1GR73_9CLOT|nr:HAD family phosphatase [Clostridium uliginosum]SFC13792.1 haloacid dehalogenase superfamily, subfamily IA, variant 3 with third motif having DD or ED/haloacid dehalogenase superfamily, subfamily IA, variant 1 with third motif having Dx(3-4)D or Dx(3-4)E [Clostridium uliginosum]
MNEIKAVLFDMDGVIFDTERIYLDIWTKVFDKYGYKMTKEVYVSVMGRGRKNVIKTFLDVYGQDLPIIRMYDEKDDSLVQVIDKGEVPMKFGAKEILNFLKENGYKIALATSAKRDRLNKQLKMGDIKKVFDAIVCGDDVINAKPDPEIFLKAAKKLSVNPENCIVIEDSPAGIKAAYNAKMIGLHVEDLKKSDEEIMKYCHKSFKNLLEIKEYLKR